MQSSKANIALCAFAAILLIVPSAARAANCGGEPSVSSTASFQTWKQWCSCMGGTSASTFNDAQRQGGCRLPSGSGSSASSTSSGSIGTIIGTEIGKELGKALFGDPEADAKRKAQEQIRAEEQRRAAEAADRKLEEQKNRLLGGMMGVDHSTPLGLMGIEPGSELKLMTDDQAELIPKWNRYKAWEQYKRDVLVYQELLTKNNPKNNENQSWCKGHIPLSMGPNSVNWESRCNPNGQVTFAGSVPTPAPKVNTVAVPVVANAPMLREPVIAIAVLEEKAKPVIQGGLGIKDLMPAETLKPLETPAAAPVRTTPDAIAPKPKDPTVDLTSFDEDVKAAAQGGFDTKEPLQGNLSVVPKTLQVVPVAAPAVAVIAAGTSNIPLPKRTSLKVERKVTTSRQAVPPAKPVSRNESSPSVQTAVAKKQMLALNCAIKELQELTHEMGDEGAQLRAELKNFLHNTHVKLNKPCSGEPETQNIQTITLSGLTRDAKKNEDHLEGSVLVTRDEKSCEVHLDVQHASSASPSGQSSNEGQSVIHLDKAGNIIVAETTMGVEKCLGSLSIKGK